MVRAGDFEKAPARNPALGEAGGSREGKVMTIERASLGALPELPPLGSGGDLSRIGLQLQVLSTEHWGLLSARSLSWNEIFARASMFLSALSGAGRCELPAQ